MKKNLPSDPADIKRNARKGKRASPWSRHPMCASKKAVQQWGSTQEKRRD
jgi:hypothetical protein